MTPDAREGCAVHCVAGLLWVHARLHTKHHRVRPASPDLPNTRSPRVRTGSADNVQAGATEADKVKPWSICAGMEADSYASQSLSSRTV